MNVDHSCSAPALPATLVYPRENYSQLIHTALGILRAQKEEELQFAQLAGFVLVTGIDLDLGMLHLAMPDYPPLPSNYLLVPTDVKNMTFIDALAGAGEK